MMTIGCDYGGPELQGSPIQLALSSAMRAAASLRSSTYDGGREAWVNLVFLVPGSIMPPADFDGLRIGHYSRKRRGVVVMAAVPTKVAGGAAIPEFMETSLRQGVALAASHFEKKGDNFDLAKANQLVDRILEVAA